jgi:hypothetical protein
MSIIMADSDLPIQNDGSESHHSVSDLFDRWREYLVGDTLVADRISLPSPGMTHSIPEEYSVNITQSHDPNRTYISDQTDELLVEELTRDGFELHQVRV